MPILIVILTGLASWYSLPGNAMANGQPFDPSAHVCAMLYEPFGERVQIENVDNGRRSWCFISDRGPFIAGRVVDVSPRVRDELGMGGLANVVVYRTVDYLPVCHRIPQPLACQSPPPKPCVLNLPKPALLRCR